MNDQERESKSEQAARRDESEEERLDRNLMELLQELRVASIGVQFLFAFLLVVPFQQGFVEVTDFEKRVYYVTLLLTAAAGICLMAPVARHRLRFRDQDKEWIVASSHKYAIAGMGLLGARDHRRDPVDLALRLRRRHGCGGHRRRRRSRSAGSGSARRCVRELRDDD